MDIRKRMTRFLKRTLDATYVTKKSFREAFQDILSTKKHAKAAKGILFRNTKEEIFMFPSRKTTKWKTKDKKEATYQFNRFIISLKKGRILQLKPTAGYSSY